MGFNDPLAEELFSGGRGLRGVSSPARDVTDPRTGRQTAAFADERFLGDGLGLDNEGKVKFAPIDNSLSEIAAAASDEAIVDAVERIADASGLARRFYINRTPATISAAKGENTLMDEPIPAGLLVDDRSVRVVMRGSVFCDFADMTIHVRVYLGGTKFYDGETALFTTDATAVRPFELDLELWKHDTDDSKVRAMGTITFGTKGTPTTGDGYLGAASVGWAWTLGADVDDGVAADMGLEQNLKVTIDMDYTGTADSDNSVSYHLRYMELT